MPSSPMDTFRQLMHRRARYNSVLECLVLNCDLVTTPIVPPLAPELCRTLSIWRLFLSDMYAPYL